jgi:undecaprenyl-diphosphatase
MRMFDSNLKKSLKNRRTIIFISSLSLICFLLITFLKSSFAAVDANVNSWSASIQSASFTQIAEMINYSFDTTSLLAVSILIAAYLFYKNHKNDALLLAVAMLGNAVIVTIVKLLVHSPRPLNGIITEQGLSFPSGHVMSAMVLFGLLTYFAWKHWKSSRAKILSILLFTAVALVVGFDRIYLNVHWFSDVLGAYSLGVFWLTFSILVFQHLGRIAKSKL